MVVAKVTAFTKYIFSCIIWLYYYPKITSIITTDWVCVKTDISRMFHESEKGDWFNYVLWQDWKWKPIYVKNVVNNYTLRKHYLGITLIQKVWWYFFIMINSLSYLHLNLIPNYNTLGKKISNHSTFWEIIIPKHNTILEK